MADDEAPPKDPPAKEKKPARDPPAKKKTMDFGISKTRPMTHSVDDVTPQTKLEVYLRSHSPVGYSDDYRSSYRPKTPRENLDRPTSSLKIEEDGRARSRTGFTPPIDVESEKFIENVTREIEKAERRSGTPPLSHRPNFRSMEDPTDNYTRKYNPIKAEFTTYSPDKPTNKQRYPNPHLSEPNIAAAVSNMLDSSGPPYRLADVYDKYRFEPIDENVSRSGSFGRIAPNRDKPDDYYGSLKNLRSYDQPSSKSSNIGRYGGRTSALHKFTSDAPVFDSSLSIGDANPMKWENDDLKIRLKQQSDELSHLQNEVRETTNYNPNSSRASIPPPQQNSNFLTKENEILKKRLDNQQMQIDKLKKEIREASERNLPDPYAGRYDSLPDLTTYPRGTVPITPTSTLPETITPSRSVKFFDDDFVRPGAQVTMDSTNANAIKNADKILAEIDELISSAKNPNTQIGSGTSSAFNKPLDSSWKSTYTGSGFTPSKNTTSFEKPKYSTVSSSSGSCTLEPPYNKTVLGGIPSSPLKTSFGYDTASSKPNHSTGSSFKTNDSRKPFPNTNYDNDHLRKVADVKAKLEAETRKQERMEAAMKEIHDRRNNDFNNTVANPPIIYSRPVITDSSRLVRPIPRQNYGTDFSPRSNNISCQVYAMDDELEGKGKAPSRTFGRGTFDRQFPQRDYSYDQPIFDGPMNDFDEEEIYPKEPAVPSASERSLDDFRRKTKGLIERQQQISENILKKFKELDLMLPSSYRSGESNSYDDRFEPINIRSQPVKDNLYASNTMPREPASRGMSSWDPRLRTAPKPSPYTRRYDSGSFSMRKTNDPWKKSIQKPLSSAEKNGFERSLSPLILDYERNGTK